MPHEYSITNLQARRCRMLLIFLLKIYTNNFNTFSDYCESGSMLSIYILPHFISVTILQGKNDYVL